MVECPSCGGRAEFSATNPWRPFCSERCKAIDLGAWASNQYVIGGNTQESAPGGEPELGEGDAGGTRGAPN